MTVAARLARQHGHSPEGLHQPKALRGGAGIAPGAGARLALGSDNTPTGNAARPPGGKRLPNRGGKGPGKRRTPPSVPYGASTSPARGGFQGGGGRSQSLPCKGRWQRVSDDGRVHCRPAPEVSCRVTPTQGGAPAGRSYVCSSSLRRIFSSSSIWPMSIQQLSLMGYTPTFSPAARYRSITSGKPIFSPSCISSTTRGSTT